MQPQPPVTPWLEGVASPLRSLSLAAALAGATVSSTLLAQTWETFLPQPDVSEVGGTQVLIDPFSTDATHPSILVGSRIGNILRLDPVDPLTYQTTPVDQSLTWVCRMVFNPADRSAYAAGQRPLVTTPPYPRTNPNIWTVRKSGFNPVSGTWSTWSDSDTFCLDTKQDATAYGLTADPAGNLYACGFANNKSGYSQWIVRRKLASGSTWSTIANFGSKGRATAYGVCYYPGNPSSGLPPALLVSGVLNGNWTVQRLESNGSWSTVDSAPLTGVARNIAFDSAGNLFVVGYRDNGLDVGLGWVVRMSTAGGVSGSWQTVLDSSEGAKSAAKYVAVDADNTLWVAGFTGTTMDKTTTQNRWTVIHRVPGQPWSDSWSARQHPFDAVSSASFAAGIATDDTGNVFVTGGVSDLTDGVSVLPGYRVVVQRLIP